MGGLKMRSFALWFVLLSAGLILAPASSQAQDTIDTIVVNIQVSPNVLNIQSQGTWVTVHTDIAYSLVDAYSVYLNGIWIKGWKADNQGNFVAKFIIDEVKMLDGLTIGDFNKLTIQGLTKDGVPFLGEDYIKIIDVIPRGL
jgi:hypothetical protein